MHVRRVKAHVTPSRTLRKYRWTFLVPDGPVRVRHAYNR
jgi:hypothetical protein